MWKSGRTVTNLCGSKQATGDVNESKENGRVGFFGFHTTREIPTVLSHPVCARASAQARNSLPTLSESENMCARISTSI
jgi:hypothetical protein